jgi:hypothetical protein
MPFAVSIAILGLVQAALVALPAPRSRPAWIGRLGSPWWTLIPALSITFVIAIVELDSDSATWLSYLALVAVPPFAALGLGALVRGSRPSWALAAVPLFALAWASPGSLAGEAAATALSGLACVSLGWLLVSAVPALWLRLGVYAMAVIDAWVVASDLLQGPNAVLNAAAPAAGLPRLQSVHFGSALMGFGDLFAAALVGCLLAANRPRQLEAALLVAVLALAFDLLFFAVDELPATVPVALALALVQWTRARAHRQNYNLNKENLTSNAPPSSL